MYKHKLELIGKLGLSVLGCLCSATSGAAQLTTPASRPGVQMTVSAEPRRGTDLPTIQMEDVMVFEGADRDPVASWIPAQGDHAGLELLVLIDDGASSDLATQFNDLRAFMQKQPPTTLIGVGYMRYGMVEILQDFTPDHEAAGKAMRIPLGSTGLAPSPYFSLQDLTKHWPANTARPRHEILMISSGIDANYSEGSQDPYVDEAIGDLQRAGVVVYSIYAPAAGHFGHSFWRINWGQRYLSQIAEGTGGESYYIGSAPAVAFSPYLVKLTQQLQHQYLLTFRPKPRQKPGLQSVRVSTELSNVDLVAADKFYVIAPAQ
jgi:hypothetical protein